MNIQGLFGTGETTDGKLGVVSEIPVINTPLQIPTSNPGVRKDQGMVDTWHDDLIREGIKEVHCCCENTVFVGNNDNLYIVGQWAKRRSSGNQPAMIKLRSSVELKRQRLRQVSVGSTHTLVLFENKQVYSFGLKEGRLLFGATNNDPKMLSRVAQEYGPVEYIAACQLLSILVTSDSRVFSSGYSTYSCLGRHEDLNLRNFTPEYTEITKYKSLLHDGERITSISNGYAHIFVLTNFGRPIFHGYSYHGEAGVDKKTEIEEPTLVPFFEEKNIRVKQISCGTFHSIFLSCNNDVYVCGRN